MRSNAAEAAAGPDVSPGNPCPFLRALVSAGTLADSFEPISRVADKLVEVAQKGEGAPTLPRAGIYAIAVSANGLSPSAMARNARKGMQLDALRHGPFDKEGAGSRILNAMGDIDKNELKRLGDFASEKTTSGGSKEIGLSLAELKVYMDANFKRAEGRRRPVDRLLMNGEWPILLSVMGKESAQGRYLSLAEVSDLFTKRLLPDRMRRQVTGFPTST